MRPLTPPPTASADGVWRNLRLAPGLAQPTQPVADGAPAALVVQQGVLRWLGPQQALPAAFADLPKHDACRACLPCFMKACAPSRSSPATAWH